MPKNLLKRWSPDPVKIRNNPALKFLGVLLHDPYLFHLNRHSVAVAFFAGLFITFLPIPGQVPLAALAALVLRCNLPITMALVWISNPLTFPIIFFAAYKLGARILDEPPQKFHFELSWEWLQHDFSHYWQPLLLGCILASCFFSCLGYVSINWLWRWNVIQRWKQRAAKRAEKEGSID